METDPLPTLLAISQNIDYLPFTTGIAFNLVVILILLFVSAFISGSEVAYFSLSTSEKQKLAGDQNKKNNYALKNLKEPNKLLATITVANNFINVVIVILSTYTINSLIDFVNEPYWGIFFQVIAISFVLIVMGEIIPRTYAAKHAFRFARLVSVPLYLLIKVLKPFNALFFYSASFINNRFKAVNSQISIDQLSQALELTSQLESKEEKEILKGIVKFGNKGVVEIMRSRVDVVSADLKDSYSKVMKMITDTGFSRIPVYFDTFDQIKGILYIKDLLPHIHKGASFQWQSLIRPPFFVPETKKIDDLLREFQKNKVHMAIVVDEYGGTSGIVTLEDVLEEIVGDITDEFDEEEKFYTKISDNKYLVDGKTLLSDFNRLIGVDEDFFDDVRGEADSLAGLILELKGEIPSRNDIISCKNFVFTIDAVDNRRIKQIKVEIVPDETL